VLAQEQAVKEDLLALMDQEDMIWRQRAKINWLKVGNRNTKFFRACASQRSRSNKISKIEDKDGILCTTQEAIEEAFVNYFQEIFQAGDHLNVGACTCHIEYKVTPQMNQGLLEEFTVDDVSKALQQIAPLKAPGPDGFPAYFYQQNWATVHAEVSSVVLHFLNSGELGPSVNFTNIALVPKVLAPVCVADFRPISLCNVLYKLTSKILGNRLKVVLPYIISSTQSAFIPGRLITDSILAAYETMHSMHTRMFSKVGFMGLKLDMSKAYDCVE
jgi:hypothetical protein